MVLTERPEMVTEEYWENLIKKSVSRYFLLDTLSKRPMHGYDIANNIGSCCEGWGRPTDGMIYPTIKELVRAGYIECVPETIDGRERKVCHLTSKGKEAHRVAAGVWANLLPYLQQSVEDAGEGPSNSGTCCA